MKKEILVRAPATVANFGPGFDIFALALEKPFDLLRIRATPAAGIRIRITDGRSSLPTKPEENTAGLAAIHFFKKTGRGGGASIEIIKRMPTGAGLGSSAASAVAAVHGLNEIFQTGLEAVEVIGLASLGEAASGGTPHADNVAACGLGGFAFIKNTSPLRIEKIDVPPIPVVIRVRKKSQTTTRALIPGQFALPLMKEQMAGCATLIHALLGGDVKKIGEAVNRDHISEPVRSRSIPDYDELKRRALEAGAYGCNVSGGGSSVFAICAADGTEAVAEAMRSLRGPGEAEPEVIITRSSNQGVMEVHGL
ncbi:MAG: homoserine kinase [Candidatus Aminicenantales bacterium]